MNNLSVFGYFIKVIFSWFLAMLLFANLIVAFNLGSLMPVPSYTYAYAPVGSYVGFSSLVSWFQNGFGGSYDSSLLTGYSQFLSSFNNALSTMIKVFTDGIKNLAFSGFNPSVSTTDVFTAVISLVGIVVSGFAIIAILGVVVGYLLYFIVLFVYYLAIFIFIFIGFMSLLMGYNYRMLPTDPYASYYDTWPMQPLVLNML